MACRWTAYVPRTWTAVRWFRWSSKRLVAKHTWSSVVTRSSGAAAARRQHPPAKPAQSSDRVIRRATFTRVRPLSTATDELPADRPTGRFYLFIYFYQWAPVPTWSCLLAEGRRGRRGERRRQSSTDFDLVQQLRAKLQSAQRVCMSTSWARMAFHATTDRLTGHLPRLRDWTTRLAAIATIDSLAVWSTDWLAIM